jgi:class 3 adenylate cyclase
VDLLMPTPTRRSTMTHAEAGEELHVDEEAAREASRLAKLGPMIRRDGDYFGTVVNVASPVAAEAAAGEVLVTPEVVAAWEGNGGIRFDSLGAVALKNVAGPVDLFRARREEVEEHG